MIRLPRAVVVTGASVGMGRATAVATLGDRAAVARGSAGLTGAADEVRHAGGEGLILPVDVTDPKAIDRADQPVADAFGRIDVWVNNAFAGVVAPFPQATPDECRRVTEVTGLCCVFGTRAALSHMLLNNRGTNAQVGPALAYRGIPLPSAYCGAKHAIQGRNASLSCELLHEGTRARTTMVQVPVVNTPQFARVLSHVPGQARPGTPVHEPDLAARAMDHAAAHPRRLASWISGSTVAPPVGNALVPGLLNRYLAYGDDAQLDEGEHAGTGNLWSPADTPRGGLLGARALRRGVPAGRCAGNGCPATEHGPARPPSSSVGQCSSHARCPTAREVSARAVPRCLAAPGRGRGKPA